MHSAEGVGTDAIEVVCHVSIDSSRTTLILNEGIAAPYCHGRHRFQVTAVREDLAILMLSERAIGGLDRHLVRHGLNRRSLVLHEVLVLEANIRWTLPRLDELSVTLARHF